MSGTFQAAPTVTFAAAMLASLDASLKPAQILTRILVSGDLLGGGQERWNVISGSKLNLAAALLLYDHLVEVRIPDPIDAKGYKVEQWIAQVTDTYGLRCTTDGTERHGARPQ